MKYRLLIMMFVSLLIIGCEDRSVFLGLSNKKVILSPSGKIKTIIYEDTEKTDRDKSYKVYLVHKDYEEKTEKTEVFFSSKTSGFEVLWIDDSILKINYDTANVISYNNLVNFYKPFDLMKESYKDNYLGSVIIKIPETTWDSISYASLGSEMEIIKGVK